MKQNQLVTVQYGGNNPGTWIHPKLVIDFARWLNADFAVWCDEQIKIILDNVMIIEDQSSYKDDDLLNQMIQLRNQTELSIKIRKDQIDQARRIKLLERDINEIKDIQEGAHIDLCNLPQPSVKAKEKTVRASLNEIVRSYSRSRFVPYSEVWGNLYRELYSRLSYNVRVRWKNCKYQYKNKLEMIENDGYLENLYAIAKEVLEQGD